MIRSTRPRSSRAPGGRAPAGNVRPAAIAGLRNRHADSASWWVLITSQPHLGRSGADRAGRSRAHENLCLARHDYASGYTHYFRQIRSTRAHDLLCLAHTRIVSIVILFVKAPHAAGEDTNRRRESGVPRRSPRSMARFRACCTTHPPGRARGHPGQMQPWGAVLDRVDDSVATEGRWTCSAGECSSTPSITQVR